MHGNQKIFLICFWSCFFASQNCRYHSESGWQTLIEIILEHYGLEVDQAAITIFVCFVPVVIDACVKLWVCPTLKIILHRFSRMNSINILLCSS